MKKLICLGSLFFTISVFFSGCSNVIPEMSETEQEAVVEYAVNTVLKYDKRSMARLKEVKEILPGNTEDNALEEEAAATPEPSALEPDPDVEIVDPFGGNQDSGPSEMALESFLNMQDFTFTYAGYETAASYPAAGEEVYFTMNATPGTSLLIMKFNAKNQTQEAKELDLLSTGVRFRITVNGETKNALSTMLLNDLSSFRGVLEAGESTELVAITEIPETLAASVESVSVIAKNEDTTATISIN